MGGHSSDSIECLRSQQHLWHTDVSYLLSAVHAAVIAINEAVDRGCVEVTGQALRNPNAMLNGLQDELVPVYQEMLRQARAQKAAQARTIVRTSDENKLMHDELLFSDSMSSVCVCREMDRMEKTFMRNI